MKAFSTLDLIRAHPWSQALFTTYSLSLSFFESVVLDALVRQEVGNNLILSDIDGIRAALSEYGARSAGRLYEIEPVAVENGCFHPKLVVLASETHAHVTIGSGNLTFGGWGANLECVDHIHPGFAADALEDVAEFLESLARTRRVKFAAGKTCSTVAGQLRTIAARGVRNREVRVIHNLERSLFNQVGEIVGDLGGARRLTIVSPFYDESSANELMSRLGLQDASLHVHEGGVVAGSTGLSWPTRHRERIVPIMAEWCNETPTRLLHAKVFEILCRKGRIIVSGSANATTAAWDLNRNVELCVVRVQRGNATAWQLSHAVPLTLTSQVIEDNSDKDRIEGILRATLTSGRVNGSVMTPFPSGEARVFRVTAAGEFEVCPAVVDEHGNFEFRAGTLETHAWSNDRLLLRIKSSGNSASGFVMFTDLSDIRTRVGAASGSLFALLAGTETPNDVAAIMDWFHEHPSALAVKNWPGKAGSPESSAPEATIAVATLLDPNQAGILDGQVSRSTDGPGWQHFLDGVLNCFREPRGPLTVQSESPDNDEQEGDPDEEMVISALPDEAKQIPIKAFERLFETMLNAPTTKIDIVLALRITQYVCDRIQPDVLMVSEYLDRLVKALVQHPPPESDQDIASAAVILWATQLNSQADISRARVIRRNLLRMGPEVKESIPDMTLVQGFARLLGTNANFDELWCAVCQYKTPQEEVRAYRLDTREKLMEADYPFLSSTSEWDSLRQSGRRGIHIMSRYSDVCPFCHNKLHASSASKLQESAITSHCGKILLCEEL